MAYGFGRMRGALSGEQDALDFVARSGIIRSCLEKDPAIFKAEIGPVPLVYRRHPEGFPTGTRRVLG